MYSLCSYYCDQGRFPVGDSMIHKAKDNDSDINAQVKQSGRPRIPLKLGLERVTHAVERGRDDSTALRVLKSKHTHTLVPYRIDRAPVYGHECTSCDTMRSVCFHPEQWRIKLWDVFRNIPMTVVNLVCLSWFTLHCDKMLRWSNTN